jgi:GTP 3',8-cyclase
MYDSFNRNINYLRISVTDRCNLRCSYCIPEKRFNPISHDQVLSFEEITSIVKVAVSMGINKIRLTGGEPLVRKNIPDLVSMIAGVEGVTDLCMTTNGMLLEHYAKVLKESGLNRLNVSLDTLDPSKFRNITRYGILAQVLSGIEAASTEGLTPIKINMVINRLTKDDDINDLKAYCRSNGYILRTIREMDRAQGVFWPVKGGEGGHCERCNRLRLSCDGYIYPCLFSDLRFSVRELGAKCALEKAIHQKPESGLGVGLKHMYTIGG